MNQIVNMVLRIFMRKILSKGIDAGFDRASRMRKGKPAPGEGATQAEIRAARRARRAEKGQGQGDGSKQAKQAMRALRRAGKL